MTFDEGGQFLPELRGPVVFTLRLAHGAHPIQSRIGSTITVVDHVRAHDGAEESAFETGVANLSGDIAHDAERQAKDCWTLAVGAAFGSHPCRTPRRRST